ncbi:hypothetical protein [Tardiphaga sp.]|uniref:hypothetical protein n=1 Tax=Tardiphaga sp. TaxID=1926292 RepID=UPI00352B085F
MKRQKLSVISMISQYQHGETGLSGAFFLRTYTSTLGSEEPSFRQAIVLRPADEIIVVVAAL